MSITVYVGDTTPYLAKFAKSVCPNSTLIDSTNYKNLKSGVYYTSLGDLENLNQFSEVLQQSDDIFYCAPKIWSEEKLRLWTEEYLTCFSFLPDKKIHNFIVKDADDKEVILGLEDTRKTEKEQIWVAGCSISNGSGVNKDQRYGALLGEALSIPVSFLTRAGSSLKWQADQILRSDIRKNDLLVWGLTSIDRTIIWKNKQIKHLNISRAKTEDEIDLLLSDQLIYDAVTSIYQVINFSNKVGVKLILASLLAEKIEPYLCNFNCFIGLHGQYGRESHKLFLDLGDDLSLPGPIMHQYYATQILKKYNQFYKDI